MPDIVQWAVVMTVGVAAGTVNTLVGGGTYLVLPLLDWLGLGTLTANATNRVAVSFQALAGLGALRRGGAGQLREVGPYAIAACLGGFPGSYAATLFDEDSFRSVVGVILLLGVSLLFIRPKSVVQEVEVASTVEQAKKPLSIFGLLLSFGFGVYAGFLGAGLGVLILLFLPRVLGVSLLRGVMFKVAIVMLSSVAASAIYIWRDHVDWSVAVPLILGNTIGGYAGGKIAIQGGDRWLRIAVAIVGGLLALSLVLGWRPSL